MLVEFIDHLLESALTGTTVAYHCGSMSLKGGRFDVSYVGTGELKGGKKAPMGPAVYFSTTRNVAKLYCQYVDGPAFYTVKIKTAGMVDQIKKLGPKKLLDKLTQQAEELEAEHGRLPYPWDVIVSMFDLLGRKETFRRLKEMGITGQYQTFSGQYGKFTEIAVYDTSVISLTNDELIRFAPGVRGRKNPDPSDIGAGWDEIEALRAKYGHVE